MNKRLHHSKFTILLFLAIFIFAGPHFVWAELSLKYVGTAQNIQLYRETSNSSQYYYSPGSIKLATDNQGKPDLKFLQMRYSGSEATGNKGLLQFKSLLQFKMVFQKVDNQQLDLLRAKYSIADNSTLNPLPLNSIKADLVYATIAEPQKKTKLNGFFESSNDDSQEETSTWNEKTFTVSLDNESSQLFWNAFEKGNTILSISYAYYAFCYLSGNESRLEITDTITTSNSISEKVSKDIKAGSDELLNKTSGLSYDSLTVQVDTAKVKELTEIMRKSDETLDSTKRKASLRLVHADAAAIGYDADLYPDLLQKIDINEMRIPPDFAVMEVRCYDFNNEIAGDLYAKRIEIEATGMNNQPVSQRVTFYSFDKNSYYRSIKFPFAVKMQLPYKYRIVEIQEDGSKIFSAWKISKNWTAIIDITKQI